MSEFYDQRGEKSERMQVSDVERDNIRVLSAGTILQLTTTVRGRFPAVLSTLRQVAIG